MTSKELRNNFATLTTGAIAAATPATATADTESYKIQHRKETENVALKTCFWLGFQGHGK